MPFVYASNYGPNGFGTILGTGSYIFINGYYILANSISGIDVSNGSSDAIDLTLANSIITGYTYAVRLDGSDTVLLTTTGTITSEDDGIISTAGGNNINIAGTMHTEDIAINIAGGGNNVSVSGSISSNTSDYAVRLSGSANDVVMCGDIILNGYGSAIFMNGSGGSAVISGTVNAQWGQVFASLGSTSLNISGDIVSQGGVTMGLGGNNLVFTGTSQSINNGFSFSGSNNVADLGGSVMSGYGALISNNGDNNYYTISGNMHSGRMAVHILNGTDNTVKITDTGSVTGGKNAIGDPDDAAGAILFDSAPGEENTLINFGTITAETNSSTQAVVAVVDAEFTDEEPGFIENSSGVLNFFNHGSVHGDIYLGAGDDLYDGVGGLITSTSRIYLGRGDDVAIGGDGREKIYGGDGDDDIEGGADKDRIYDGSDDDIVDAGDGNDYVRVGGGNDTYYGGEGKDYISYYDSSGGVTLDLEANLASRSWASNDQIDGFESASGSRTGADRIYGTSTSNTIKTYGGEDRLYGRDGADRLYGGDDDDRLYGGRGADQLFGGDGDDFLDGGTGEETDLLFGEGGADAFHFDRGEGYDIVKDFQNNIDTIEFDNFGYLGTAADALAYAVQDGSDVLFDFGSDGSMLIEGATLAQLSNDIAIV
ncbi:hypothetical protein O4H61_15145 [Roseovarius aestuarii]|nr:hypothetical protein [Roseovarius aestuarii]